MNKAASTFAAGLALCGMAPAQAAPAVQCLNTQERHGLIGYFLPEVIGEVSKNCSAHLPAGSYLRTRLPQVAAQLVEAKPQAWPVAKAAFLKMGDPKDSKQMASLPDEALRPLIDAVMASKMTIPVTPSTCAEVNDISEALAPLSPDQTVHLLATIFNAVARKDNKLRSCPRETQ
jgi:hypothetical protein